MHDIRTIRENPSAFDAALARRGDAPVSSDLLALDEARRARIQAAESAQAEQNKASKEVGAAKGRGDDAEFERLRALVAAKKAEVAAMQNAAKDLDAQLTDRLARIANLPAEDVPEGRDETANVEIARWGTPTAFSFAPKEHFDITAVAAAMDFETAAKTSGSRFVNLSKGVARIHRALAQFMLDTHTGEHGYTEVNVPNMVNGDSAYGTGQLPKFGEDLFKLTDERGFYLIPTAEVPVTNFVRDEIVDGNLLPMKFACHSLCFRSEAGSYGRDTRGMIRQHQFEKVELVQLVKPEDSKAAHEELTLNAEAILQKLGLPYRTVVLCGGDLGFSAELTYDLEVWLPGQDAYREISSCSNFGDFQARRMQARWRNPETGKPELIHTINGSGLAVGRTLIAVLENYQNADGSITVPDVLRSYMGGIDSILKPSVQA